jgi:hypothetical protein
MALAVSFDVPGIGQMCVQADFHELGVLVSLNRLFGRSAYAGAATLFFYGRLFVDARKRGVTSKQFANFIVGTKHTDCRVTSVHFSASGHKIELLGLLNICFQGLNSLDALINTPMKPQLETASKGDMPPWLNALNALINTPSKGDMPPWLNALNALINTPMKPQLETASKGDMPPKTIT